MCDELKGFACISLREQSAVDALSNHGVVCQQNIDPVFLLGRDEWESLSDISKLNKQEGYVLIYTLQKSRHLVESALRYAEKNNLDVIIISTGIRRNYQCRYIDNCSPEEFVGLFLNASAIFTNSFHGIAFSILSNNPFFFELQEEEKGTNSRNSRLQDLIQMFGLQNRNLCKIKDVENCGEIDYLAINRIIDVERKKSYEYLRRMIYR